MNSRDYWERRAAQDMYDRMGTAEDTAAEMNAAIRQTSAYLEKEVKAVMRGMQSFGISEAEAKKILNAAGGDGSALQRLRKAAQQVSDPERREALLNAINSAGAYRYRITRIEELNKDINRQCRELYKTENRHITSALRNVAEDSYYHEIFSIQKGTGLGFSFSKFPRQDVDRILRANWSGANYSQRIWKDVSGMTARLKSELLVSMLSGRSGEKTARIFQEQFGVNAFCARRIVRTESAYVANAAQAKAYGEAGIERYRFVATLDSRTCECCAALDGKVFDLAKAKPGTNYPPMHPFCRSTTIADFGDEELAGLERRAKDKDGNTVKVPAGMTYEEWRREFVDNKSTSENMKGPAPEIGKRKDPCANGHYFIDKSETPPTCTEDGKREKVCAVCGKTEVETVPATGHRYVDTIVQPTCTEKGYTLHKCSVCGDSYQDAETQPLGHNYEAVKTVQPTCVDKGFTEYCCTRCGDTYTDDIPATGHKFGKYKIVTKPTSVSEGLKVRNCKVCGESDEVALPKTKTVTKAEKKQKLLDIINGAQQDIDKIAQKQYNNIWKNPVTAADYSTKQSAIQAKKDYFNQQLASNPADKAKWQALLNDLDDFETQGKKYAALQATKNQAQSQLTKLASKSGSSASFAPDAYSQSRKNAAYWFKGNEKASADAALRPKSGTVWQAASSDERQAAWKYTSGSGSFNRPLRGYDGNWYNYKGVGNVSLDNEGSGSAIKHLTDLIDRSQYNFDIWLNRGIETSSGAASFLKIPETVLTGASQSDLNNLLVGKVVKDEAFVSCGSAKGAGFSGYIFNIYAPKGTKMLYAEPFSAFGQGHGQNWDGLSGQTSFGGEFETIIQRGTEFRITKVDKQGSNIFFDIEVVNQP